MEYYAYKPDGKVVPIEVASGKVSFIPPTVELGSGYEREYSEYALDVDENENSLAQNERAFVEIIVSLSAEAA